MFRDPWTRRFSIALLRLLPFVAAAVVEPRALRVPGAYQTVGVVLAALVAGATWTLAVGPSTTPPRGGTLLLAPTVAATMSDVRDGLLFVGCALTYVGTAAFACALGRRRWLGRRAVMAFVGVSGLALVLLLLRGLAFPDPGASSTPWYMRPGFVAGIPAIPWIMPALLGVVVLRRSRRPEIP